MSCSHRIFRNRFPPPSISSRVSRRRKSTDSIPSKSTSKILGSIHLPRSPLLGCAGVPAHLVRLGRMEIPDLRGCKGLPDHLVLQDQREQPVRLV